MFLSNIAYYHVFIKYFMFSEDAIPAHKNCIPSSQGTPTTVESPHLKFKFDGDTLNFLTVEVSILFIADRKIFKNNC